VGTVDITPVTGDGYQFMRIAGAVAADDPWLVTGDDTERFRFEVITSGSEAMNLQATGGEGYVDLMWTQDDFDLLAGFNLYRATSLTGTTYARLNDSIIPPDQRTFRDSDVQPGQPYYYYFKVVKSDLTESDPSNTTTATPVDTIPPVINHTPVTEASPGMPLTLYADVTDNVSVHDVTLYYRPMGASGYLSRTMTHTTGDRYSATIEGSRLTSPGLEYYIVAYDGVSAERDGRPDYPHQIVVEDKPTLTAITPDHGPTAGGTQVTVSGSNFKAGATVTFGGAVAGDVAVLSSNQITCTTPAHFPETVDVIVTNPDNQSGTLLRGFTYESDTAVVGLPDVESGQNSIVQIPINAANVEGLAAADVTVTFDESVLSAQGADTGSLTPGWELSANTNTTGQITVSVASGGGTASGSGVLATLEFMVVGSPAMTSTLEMASVSFNDGAIPVQPNDGRFMVSLVYEVMGTVSFWQNSNPISGTQLTLVGDRIYGNVSDSGGAYTVTNVPEGDYTLTPSKSDDVDGITAYDASQVLQHATGLSTLSGYAFTAGDVNKSGQITSMDAFYILQKAVDLINLPFTGAGVIWEFDPDNRSYTGLSSDQAGQDFTGVLIGDVSGNWTPARVMNLAPGPGLNGVLQSTTATLSLPDATVLSGEQVTFPLSLDLPEGEVEGVDLTITYDPSIASLVQVTKGGLTTDWNLVTNTGTPGEIRVALAGAEPIQTSGELLNIVFEATGSAGDTTDLTLTQGMLDEENIPANPEHGQLAIATPAAADFTATPLSGGAPLTVVFTNTSTGDYAESLWDFGDGMTSTQESPAHTYTTAGNYTVQLTVSGSGGTDTETKSDWITVEVYELSGAVRFWNDATALAGVDMTLVGDQTYTTTSATNGGYTFDGLNTGPYTLTPAKTDDVRGITAYDASYVLRHAAGLLTLSGDQASAADVDQSGVISSLDASYILRKAVDLIDVPFPDAGDVWVFNPTDRSYPNVSHDLTNQDFNGVLLGDVSGNWASTGTQMASTDAPPITVEVQGHPLSSNNIVTATVWLDADQASVYGLDLRLLYDPKAATLLSVSKGELANAMQLVTNVETDGEIQAAIAGTESITGEGTILLLAFRLQDASTSTILDPIWGQANEGEVAIELRSDLIGDGYKVYLPLVTQNP
jgi:PKD repeat protein